MTMDIFSGFDDHNNVVMDLYLIIWMGSLAICWWFCRFYWTSANRHISIITQMMTVGYELAKGTKALKLGVPVAMFTGVTLVLPMINLVGLVPYAFSPTSHISLTMISGGSAWLVSTLMALNYDLPGYLAHFQPLGAPAPLNPFLCIVEFISTIIRPITLCVRLAANMTTGHVIVALMGTAFAATSSLSAQLLLIVVGAYYFIFEMAVCLVQAYVFAMLSNLYFNDIPTDH